MTNDQQYGSMSMPSNAHQHQFGLYGGSRPPLSLQLYDEFVSKGNVAVLKCLVLATTTTTTTSSVSSPSSQSGDSLSAVTGTGSLPSYPSKSYHYLQQQNQGSVPIIQSSHHRQPYYGSFDFENIANDFIFEWRIKNGPAASASTGEIILTLRSNQTQGRFQYNLEKWSIRINIYVKVDS